MHSRKIICLIIFAVGMLLGTILTNRIGSGYVEQMSMFSYVSEHNLSSGSYNSFELAAYIAGQRLPIILFIWVMYMSMFGNLVFYGYLFYFSFSMGAVLSMETLIYGMRSIFIFLGSSFPHYLFYLAGLYILYQRGVPISQEWYQKTKSEGKRDVKALLKEHLITLALILLVFGIGVLAESFISPLIIGKLL